MTSQSQRAVRATVSFDLHLVVFLQAKEEKWKEFMNENPSLSLEEKLAEIVESSGHIWEWDLRGDLERVLETDREDPVFRFDTAGPIASVCSLNIEEHEIEESPDS